MINDLCLINSIIIVLMNSNVYGEETGQKIELFLNARGLGDLDFFSKSDPYVKVFFKRHPN
jgi:hypothetical protein